MNYQITGESDFNHPKIRKTDRILVLKIMDGKKPKSSTGSVDPRTFSGENRLHAIQDVSSRLWKLKYDFGGLPEVLKQEFTRFDMLYTFAKGYFQRRNLDIVEVID